MNHLYEDADKIIHECQGSRMIETNPDTYIVWTKCEIDVPPDKSFKSKESVTCEKCKDKK